MKVHAISDMEAQKTEEEKNEIKSKSQGVCLGPPQLLGAPQLR